MGFNEGVREGRSKWEGEGGERERSWEEEKGERQMEAGERERTINNSTETGCQVSFGC